MVGSDFCILRRGVRGCFCFRRFGSFFYFKGGRVITGEVLVLFLGGSVVLFFCFKHGRVGFF